MGLADAFAREDRVSVSYSDFYKLMRESAKAELMANGVKQRVPHKHLYAMITGAKLEPPKEENDDVH